MRVKAKDGLHIEVRKGTFEDLGKFLNDLFSSDEDKEVEEQYKIFKEISALFDKQSLEGQDATIKSLMDKYKNNIIETCKCECSKCNKEELKEDANNKADC